MKLEGKIAIVTGGGQGIGQGIVYCLAEEGADVAVVDINGVGARKVADHVKGLGRKSLAVEADLTDGTKVAQAVQEIINTFGKIDILVNNAGGLGKIFLGRTSTRFIDQGDAEWDEAFTLNLRTNVLMSRAVVPYFMKQRSGKIVNISSQAGIGPGFSLMTYGAAKQSVTSFTRTLAGELAEYDINVNGICPGMVYTAFPEGTGAQFKRLNPDKAKGITTREWFLKSLARTPLKREQTPEDIGRAVVFLASEDAKNITGQLLNINGGMMMG